MVKVNSTDSYNMTVIQNALLRPLLDWISLETPVKMKKIEKNFQL